jgi:Ras-related GTP-binding protein C/D
MDIIITGFSKSGKSSIKKVLFEKLEPQKTLFPQSQNTEKHLNVEIGYSSFFIREFPAEFNPESMRKKDVIYLQNCNSLVYIIDSNDIEIAKIIMHFKLIFDAAIKINSNIKFYTFYHKFDNVYCSSSIDKRKMLNDIKIKLKEISKEANINCQFFVTSIFDFSIFEAFSEVISTMGPEQTFISSLLDNFSTSCKIDNIFLYDINYKICFARDSAPKDESFEKLTLLIEMYSETNSLLEDLTEDQAPPDEDSYLIVKKSDIDSNRTNITFYIKMISKNICLLCKCDSENLEKERLINYNIEQLKKGIKEILKVYN